MNVDENRATWSNYNWSEQGDEWSKAWGGTGFLWYGSILPRIQAFVPAETILELAPGFGRCTQFLKDWCNRLVLVDLTEQCIQACQHRFASSTHITYFVNDGKSLDLVPDKSVDFVFSWDSLVHAEADVLEAYLDQLAQKLTLDGVGFIHHSNLGAYTNCQTGKLDITAYHYRAETMTAEKFRHYCEQSGLSCVGQELVSWGKTELTDCISLFARAGSKWARHLQMFQNDRFMSEASYLRDLSTIYGFS